MKISILAEGKTERGFKPHLIRLLEGRLAGKMPRLDIFPYHGRIPKEAKLRRAVENLLATGHPPSDAVIALTDVYTGSRDFRDATDAKQKMREWVGPEDRFFPHAAQHDFEAWLLPYWDEIQTVAGHNRKAPSGRPETINHVRPPSVHVREIFRLGKRRRDYSKARDANRILRGKDLAVAAAQCPELRSLLNTILGLCGAKLL